MLFFVKMIDFRDLILPWLGRDTYLLYAPVCRTWAAAYPEPITHPKHLVADVEMFTRHRDDMGDMAATFVARHAQDTDVFALVERDDDLTTEAIKYGNMIAFNWFWSGIYDDVHEAILTSGRVEFFKFLDEDEIYEDDWSHVGKSGNLEAIEWFTRQDFHFEDASPAAVGAVQCGHVHVLDWLDSNSLPWRERRVTEAAAGAGSIQMLEELIRRECPADNEWCIHAAIRSGHLETLDWLFARYEGRSSRFISAAVRSDRFAIAKWLFERGVPMHPDALHDAVARSCNCENIKWFIDSGAPIYQGVDLYDSLKRPHEHMDIIKLLYAEGYRWSPAFFLKCIRSKRFELAWWMLRTGHQKLSVGLLRGVLREADDLGSARWLLDVGCPIDGTMFDCLLEYDGDDLQAAFMINEAIVKQGATPRYGCGHLLTSLAYRAADPVKVIDYLYKAGYPLDAEGLLDMCCSDAYICDGKVIARRAAIFNWYMENVCKK